MRGPHPPKRLTRIGFFASALPGQPYSQLHDPSCSCNAPSRSELDLRSCRKAEGQSQRSRADVAQMARTAACVCSTADSLDQSIEMPVGSVDHTPSGAVAHCAIAFLEGHKPRLYSDTQRKEDATSCVTRELPRTQNKQASAFQGVCQTGQSRFYLVPGSTHTQGSIESRRVTRHLLYVERSRPIQQEAPAPMTFCSSTLRRRNQNPINVWPSMLWSMPSPERLAGSNLTRGKEKTL